MYVQGQMYYKDPQMTCTHGSWNTANDAGLVGVRGGKWTSGTSGTCSSSPGRRREDPSTSSAEEVLEFS
jgi:hypothetical protein